MADRAKALAGVSVAHAFQDGGGHCHRHRRLGTNSKMVLVDRGTVSGRGTRNGGGDAGRNRGQGDYGLPHGIGQVLLITDPDFAAGVISQKGSSARHAQGAGNAHLQGGLRAFRR
jgi:hypothetical protein